MGGTRTEGVHRDPARPPVEVSRAGRKAPKSVLEHASDGRDSRVGLTLIRKSRGAQPKRDAKVALVLAGGAVSGGAFKVGGLKALDDFLVDRKMVEFDTYVGLSAGSILAVALRNADSDYGHCDCLDASDIDAGHHRARNLALLASEADQ